MFVFVFERALLSFGNRVSLSCGFTSSLFWKVKFTTDVTYIIAVDFAFGAFGESNSTQILAYGMEIILRDFCIIYT